MSDYKEHMRKQYEEEQAKKSSLFSGKFGNKNIDLF